ncbi:eukaryotic translation initiation factor 2-alpha kinase 1-like [Copidosoma floridanum]|uniref:eukaryotic translation initiation factor 2-alpha kinase 1-like n=1 Tax=Copidosoma floridanum TaxID=29053 RepID=UPI000C6F8BD1|nr:eukaryotic translation initiation factor 2-alpha kinase 1-like [Copidosoma floridanum]
MEKKSKNPWYSLSTVTTFDKGTGAFQTRYFDKNRKEKNINKVIKKCSPSVLITSLLNYICYLSEKDPEQKQNLYSLLCNVMQKMDLIDSSHKIKPVKLADGKYMDAVYQLINVARSVIGNDKAISIPRPVWSYISLYQDQFIETGFIAGGGFGSVFKAKHKLDEVEYAIKKIIVKPGKIKTIIHYLEEVKTLAKLNHSNIVSYKQAWIEPYTAPCLPQLTPLIDLRNDESVDIESCTKSCRIFSGSQRLRCSYEVDESCSDSISFRGENSNPCSISIESDTDNNAGEDNLKSEKISDTRSNLSSFEEKKEEEARNVESDINNKINTGSGISTEESSDESLENIKICQYSREKKLYTILYIQMALCEKTLRHWLDDRTEPTPVSVMADIATQILCGLNYIHSLNIVHHDIKPSNIFISTSGKLRIQLGDFGLACPLQKESHNSIVGTCMYAAPEQLNGECNPMSDVYSLGIVFLELLVPMKTVSECVEMINHLKSNQIPSSLASSHQKWINTIKKLLNHNPAQRPSSSELLEDLRIDKDLTISKLEHENSRLRHENEKKDQTISELQNFIKNLQDQLKNLQEGNLK